jgi:DNA-directed RNA polymerase subunit RPC12/RpoP
MLVLVFTFFNLVFEELIKDGHLSLSVISSKNSCEMLTKIGSGNKIVTLSYKSWNFGPICARNENEVQNIYEFFKYKIKEREYKDKHGGNLLKGVCTTTVANNAKFALPSDVVQYIEKSLTKKEMKKKTIGRKSINYPKRSEIIKIDPVIDLPPKIFDNKVAIEISDNDVSSDISDNEMASETSDKDMLPEISDEKVSPEISDKVPEAVNQSNWTHASFDLDDYARGIKPKLMYHCVKCDEKFESVKVLNHHFKITHEKVNLFKCKMCDKKFQIEPNLQRHMKLHHDKHLSPGKKLYRCSKCPKFYDTESCLKRHEVLEHKTKKHAVEKKIFQCSKCPNIYSRKSNLTRHETMEQKKPKNHV